MDVLNKKCQTKLAFKMYIGKSSKQVRGFPAMRMSVGKSLEWGKFPRRHSTIPALLGSNFDQFLAAGMGTTKPSLRYRMGPLFELAFS